MNQSASSIDNELKAFGLHRWLIVACVMLVAIIEVLDMTIVNVALPHMMGSLSANQDQITWVLTSYIVASAIFMPLTGFLIARLGRRKLLLINIVGFLIASMLCGVANSLATLVFFRTLQGVFGAGLVPISQYVLRDTFAPEEQGFAMAIWGVGVMVAPILGPTLGGYITEHLSWRWTFYINFPVCIIAFFLATRFIKETTQQAIKIDWLGLGFMAVGIGCLQIFLDRGNQEGWLQSNLIIILILISIFCLGLFIIRGFSIKDNIINLRLFKNRNFAACTLMLTVFGIGLFGTMAIQPIQLEHLLNYPALTTGWLLAPRGLASAIGMFLAGSLLSKIDPRKFIVIGILLSAYGTYLTSQFNLETNMMYSFIIPSLVQGLGIGLFFAPLAALSLLTLAPSQVAEASGLFSFGRSLGSSIGISIVTTVVSRSSQRYWHQLHNFMQPFNPNFHRWLSQQHLTLHSPQTAARLQILLTRQSSMLSFNHAYLFITFSFLIMLPFTLLIEKPDMSKLAKAGAMAH